MKRAGDVASSEAAYAADRGKERNGPAPRALSSAPGESARIPESHSEDPLRKGEHDTSRHDIHGTAELIRYTQ